MLIIKRPEGPTQKKLPQPKAEPIILGVIHSPEDEENELQWVAERLSERAPGKVALEIPANFREKEERGITTFFFGRLVRVSELLDSAVVPLDHPLLVKRTHIVSKALELLEEGYSGEEIARNVMTLAQSSFYAPPETEMVGADTLAHAYLLIRLGENKESLGRIWASLMRRREKFMKKIIQEEKPSVVVVGDSHAENLRGQLEGYSYEKSPFVPNDNSIRRFSI